MSGPASSPKPARRTRLTRDARREMLIEKAVEFFYQNGLSAQLRDFAAAVGVSEGLIFHYFGTRQALMDQVYSRVYSRSWSDVWLVELQDRAVPLRERIENFYAAYLASVDREAWIRGSIYASMTAPDQHPRLYLHRHIEEVLDVLMKEIGDYAGLARKPNEMDRELVWHLHSSIIYYLIRKHLLKLEVAGNKRAFVRRIVGNFFCELERLREGSGLGH